jgi:hypothetical protein
MAQISNNNSNEGSNKVIEHNERYQEFNDRASHETNK